MIAARRLVHAVLGLGAESHRDNDAWLTADLLAITESADFRFRLDDFGAEDALLCCRHLGYVGGRLVLQKRQSDHCRHCPKAKGGESDRVVLTEHAHDLGGWRVQAAESEEPEDNRDQKGDPTDELPLLLADS